MPCLRQPHAERRIRDGRAEDRHVHLVRRGQDPVRLRFVPEVLAQPVQEFTGGMRPLLERRGELRDPDVVPNELVFVDERVVDPIDVGVGEGTVVGAGRSEKMPVPASLVQVVVQVGAGRHHAVDRAPADQLRDDQAEPSRAQRAGDPEEDQQVVVQHPLPHSVGARRGSAPGTRCAPSGGAPRRPAPPARCGRVRRVSRGSGTCRACGDARTWQSGTSARMRRSLVTPPMCSRPSRATAAGRPAACAHRAASCGPGRAPGSVPLRPPRPEGGAGCSNSPSCGCVRSFAIGAPAKDGRPPRDSSSRSSPARICRARATVRGASPARRATWMP